MKSYNPITIGRDIWQDDPVFKTWKRWRNDERYSRVYRHKNKHGEIIRPYPIRHYIRGDQAYDYQIKKYFT